MSQLKKQVKDSEIDNIFKEACEKNGIKFKYDINDTKESNKSEAKTK